MKNIKEKIIEYRPTLYSLLDSKTPVPVSRILEIKALIAEAESELKTEFSLYIQKEILTLKLCLKTLRLEHFDHKQLQEKLQKFLPRLEKACYDKEPMKDFPERIQYLEEFIAAINFSIEELDIWEKTKCEMDILLLELYVDYAKNKFSSLLKKELPVPKLDLAQKQFIQHLKLNSAQDHKEFSEELNKHLRRICAYLHKNPQLFTGLESGQSTYISKEITRLFFTVQVKNTGSGFELYVSLKTKLEDWVRSGAYKKVKKNLMLIKGEWHNGVDAIAKGEKDSKDSCDKINLALEEAKLIENLDSLYVHKISPAAAYTHKSEYKHSFVSELADGCLDDVIYDSKLIGQMSIGEIFLLCYSMASALSYIHSPSVNLVHCDVKGNNFLIFADAEGIVWVKLADFGLAGYSLNDTARSYDVKSMLTTWWYLLDNYNYYRQPTAPKNEVYNDLFLFCQNILETYIENPPTDATVISGLHLILEKMQLVQPQESEWVKAKIEKYYGKLIAPAMKEAEKICLQRFFTKNLKKPASDIKPEERYGSKNGAKYSYGV